jgi:hypothetical protein
MAALKEARRDDSAELLHRAIRAREVQLEGRRDREAAQAREQAPTLGQQIELLAYAADLWQEFGHEEKAKVVGELAERMRSSWRRGGEPRRETRNQPQGRRDALVPRIAPDRAAGASARRDRAGPRGDQGTVSRHRPEAALRPGIGFRSPARPIMTV